MNSYNGYTPHQRMKALNWLKKEWAAGRREKTPKQCDMCSQTEGNLAYHSEDYSEPYGDHIGQFGLCYTCHMMIHCRYKSADIWNIYIEALTDKKCFEPIYGNGWNVFRQECLQDRFKTRGYTLVETNNVDLMKAIGSGDYAISANVSHSKSVGSLF
jgi:hypothetical protein